MKPRSAKKRKAIDALVKAISMCAALLGILFLGWILVVVLQRGLAAINWKFFTALPTPPGIAGGGVANAILGTLLMTVIATLLGVPTGILAGVYLAEFGKHSRLGAWAYAVEPFLIIVLAMAIAILLAGFLHVVYRVLGGQGPFLNSWKAVCYGTGPCVLLGWIPYWTLFVGAWSLTLQMYFGPKVLYRIREGRALAILAFIVGAALMEFAIKGTTVGF